MAAATISSVTTESFGSKTLVIATFTNIDDTNTWTSGITNATGYWCDPTDAATDHHNAHIDVSYVISTGVFTFNCGENGRTGKLYVLK